jgi:hypothetical protein
MSIRVDSASDDATRAAYPLPTGAGTIVQFFKPTTNWNSDGADHMLFDMDDGTGSHFFKQQKWTDNNLYCGWFDAAEYRIIVASANYTILQNKWNVLIHDYDTDAAHAGAGAVQHLELNGTVIGTRSSAFTTPDLSAQTLHLGNGRASNQDIRGDLWHTLVYNRVLTSAEKLTARAGGVPATAFSLYRLDGDLNDSAAGARHLTGTGLTFANGPYIPRGLFPPSRTA